MTPTPQNPVKHTKQSNDHQHELYYINPFTAMMSFENDQEKYQILNP